MKQYENSRNSQPRQGFKISKAVQFSLLSEWENLESYGLYLNISNNKMVLNSNVLI